MVSHSKCALPFVAFWGVRAHSSFGPNSQLHEPAAHLAVSLRAVPELLGTVAWGTRVGLESGRSVPLPRDFRSWPILALERLNRDLSKWRHRTAPKLDFQ